MNSHWGWKGQQQGSEPWNVEPYQAHTKYCCIADKYLLNTDFHHAYTYFESICLILFVGLGILAGEESWHVAGGGDAFFFGCKKFLISSRLYM